MSCDSFDWRRQSVARVNTATDAGHGFRGASFQPVLVSIRLVQFLEIKIMKTRLLVISAFLALTVSACGDDAARKAEAAKAEAAKVAKEAAQKADDAARQAGAAVGAAADATKEAGKEAMAATKEAGKEMIVKAADATRDAADKAKAAVTK
jgi:hypothetical protein